MAKNIASGDDRVAVQVGRVGGDPDASRKAKEKAEQARQKATKAVRGANVREGDATVGVQVDEVRGGLTFGGGR